MSYVTEVIVYKHGKPVKGVEVSLEFNGNFTEKFMTNSSGVAHVKHSSTGKAHVYVDGHHSSHGTSGTAPGRIIVDL